MKKIWAIIGLGVAVGAAAYVIWEKAAKVKNDAENTPDEKVTQTSKENTVQPVAADGVDGTDEARNMAANSMSERHEEAAQIMRDAVDMIYRRSEVSEDETAELDRISRELDNLLNEE